MMSALRALMARSMGTKTPPAAAFKAKFDPNAPGSKAAAIQKNMAFAAKELSAPPDRRPPPQAARVSSTAHVDDRGVLGKLHR